MLHLAEGGSSEGLLVKAIEDLFDRASELALNDFLCLLSRKSCIARKETFNFTFRARMVRGFRKEWCVRLTGTWNVVLKLLELINVFFGENINAGRQKLPQLDKCRPKFQKSLQRGTYMNQI